MAVVDGRHPVVERRTGSSFVPNDTTLNAASSQLVILTGPNMGGKSTCPAADGAALPDGAGRIVRPGSRGEAAAGRSDLRARRRVDNIARGQSTFMVEMQETASILHLATSRSLVVLDEIGRARRPSTA
jgi:dsDNA-specific endonuclease/ATPase MutS2